jgi:hypothetical protein
MSPLRCTFFAGLLLAATCLAGCGGGHKYAGTNITGNVTIGGQPVEKGNLQFVPAPETKGTIVSAEVRNGRYTAEKVPTGLVRVMLVATRETGETEEFRGKQVPKLTSIVPDKYKDGEAKEIKADTKNLDITW